MCIFDTNKNMGQKAPRYSNDTVVYTSQLVEKPVAVRYVFRNEVKGEFFGTEDCLFLLSRDYGE